MHAEDSIGRRGIWGRVAGMVGAHARRTWIVTFVLLAACAAFVPTFEAKGVTQSDLFLTTVDSVTGQEVLAPALPRGFGLAGGDRRARGQGRPGGPGARHHRRRPEPAGRAVPGQPPKVVDGQVLVQATLVAPADSVEAESTVETIRTRLDEVGTEVLVGGSTAVNLDVRQASERDLKVIIPAILGVIFVVLLLLLRSITAPLVLVAANVLSFAATIGVSALVFNHVFHFPGSDPSTPLYGFVFLVALGIDYSIFLMTRVREESRIRGTRPGILVGLAVTGGVITSAGIVLASTFSALAVLPILFLAQIAFIVAFGVLLDTLVVRSLLVPAVSYDLGRQDLVAVRPASGRGARGGAAARPPTTRRRPSPPRSRTSPATSDCPPSRDGASAATDRSSGLMPTLGTLSPHDAPRAPVVPGRARGVRRRRPRVPRAAPRRAGLEVAAVATANPERAAQVREDLPGAGWSPTSPPCSRRTVSTSSCSPRRAASTSRRPQRSWPPACRSSSTSRSGSTPRRRWRRSTSPRGPVSR